MADWFDQNDPDTTIAVKAHVRARPVAGGGSFAGPGTSLPGATSLQRAEPPLMRAAPTIGGTVGGLIGEGIAGPPGMISGSTLGGMAGRAGELGLQKMLGYQGPANAQEAMHSILSAGVGQGAAGLTGLGIARGASAVALPVSKRVASVLSARTEDVVRNADRSGVHIDATKATDVLAPFVAKARAAGKATEKALQDFRDNFLANRPNYSNPATGTTGPVMTASEAHDAKEFYDSMARSVREAKRGGTLIGPAERLQGQYAEALSNRLRTMLRDQVPGYSEALKAESKNLGARKAVTAAAKGATYLGTLGAIHEIPGAKDLPWWAKGALAWQGGRYASRALASPAVLDALSHAALNPALLKALRYSPRLATLGADLSQPSTQGGY